MQNTYAELISLPVTFEVLLTQQYLGSKDRSGRDIIEDTYSALAFFNGYLIGSSDDSQIFRSEDDAIESAKIDINTKHAL